MEIIFKKAEISDIKIILVMMSEFYTHEKLDYNQSVLQSALEGLINNGSAGEVRVINYGSNIAGYFVLTFTYSLEYGGKNALLDELYVRENFRGKGIGRQVLSFIEEFCREKSIHAIHLQVKKFNPLAKRLYTAVGFEEVDRVFMTKVLF